MATPMLAAIKRCGSCVEASATTANTTSPGFKYFWPSRRESSLQFGGKMEETRTRFCAAMPASRSANSNEVRRSLCLPTPFVRNICFGTMFKPNELTLLRNVNGRNKLSEKYLVCGNFVCKFLGLPPSYIVAAFQLPTK